jgi:hypothetical protein
MKRSYSTRSTISSLLLDEQTPDIDKSPRRREVVIHQDIARDTSRDTQLRESGLSTNRWTDMKLEEPHIYLRILYANMLASLFTWLLLAGFMVIPVTFASLRSSRALSSIGKAGRDAFNAIQHMPFLAIAGICFFIGVGGLSYIWWDNKKNYIWLTERVFL